MATDLLRKGLKLSHLRLLAALAEHGKIGTAGDVLGITQPAASRLAAEVESLSGTVLYERTGRGVQLTRAGQLLAFRSARVLKEIGDAGRDIEELREGLSGHVKIGSVTGPAIEYVLPAIRHIRLTYPGISIEVDVATSDVLAPMLLDGRLDFALCRLPVGSDRDLFRESPQMSEPVCIVARDGHPLLRGGGEIATERLLAQDWVMPPAGAILRTTVERTLRARRLLPPERVLTTSSFLFTLAMVRQTNAIAPLSTAVAEAFGTHPGQSGSVVILPAELKFDVETYSLLTQAGQVMTPAAEFVFAEVSRMIPVKPLPVPGGQPAYN